ncbi:MAG TPA: hypothetical protein VFL79_12790 [Terriglobia bacterium]|nr:hypothetical protein [Terriglobia bacterium]
MGFTVKLELVRRGNPVRLRLTFPVKPPDGVTMIVSVPLELTGTVIVAEEALSEKSAFTVPLTVRPTVVVCCRVPLVPVIVKVYVPAGVVLMVEMVSVELVVAGLGLKPADAPLGIPLTFKVTLPVNPFEGVIFTV